MILQIALNDNRYMKPIVRIKGYEKDWISCLLSDCLTICNERNHQLQYGKKDALSVSDEYGVVNQIQHLGRSYAGKDVSGYKILRKNQIVYTKSPLKQKPYGIIKVNDNEDGIVSVLYAVYDTKNGIYPDFLNRYFEPYGRINKYLIPIINKGAKNTINVSDAQVLQGRINIPVSEDEQKAIANFFSDLDKLIVTSTNRVSSLRKMKAASLQTMFPQKGETKPKVRFKGFEGDWRIVSFGSLIKECEDKSLVENEDVLLTSAITGMYLNSEIFGHQRGRTNVGYRKLRKNMLVLSAQNLHLGNANVNLRFEHGLVSPAYKIYDLIDINPQFMHQWIKREETKKFFLDATTAGASLCRKNIVWEDLYKQTLRIPSSLQEQEQLGKYFTTLDKQISLEEQKIESLKRIKSACLDKMFV